MASSEQDAAFVADQLREGMIEIPGGTFPRRLCKKHPRNENKCDSRHDNACASHTLES
jgi:hypothetical protein